jgi:hypothetical protein
VTKGYNIYYEMTHRSKVKIVIDSLIWNDENITHIARHDVTPEEVNQACEGDIVALESYENRYLVIGITIKTRFISVVLAPKGGGIYLPITARSSSRKERRVYQETFQQEVA